MVTTDTAVRRRAVLYVAGVRLLTNVTLPQKSLLYSSEWENLFQREKSLTRGRKAEGTSREVDFFKFRQLYL